MRGQCILLKVKQSYYFVCICDLVTVSNFKYITYATNNYYIVSIILGCLEYCSFLLLSYKSGKENSLLTRKVIKKLTHRSTRGDVSLGMTKTSDLVSTWGFLRWERCWPAWIRPSFMEWDLARLRVGGQNRGHVSSLSGIPQPFPCSPLLPHFLHPNTMMVLCTLTPSHFSLLDTHSESEVLWVIGWWAVGAFHFSIPSI